METQTLLYILIGICYFGVSLILGFIGKVSAEINIDKKKNKGDYLNFFDKCILVFFWPLVLIVYLIGEDDIK